VGKFSKQTGIQTRMVRTFVLIVKKADNYEIISVVLKKIGDLLD